MTKVITRYFEDAARGEMARRELLDFRRLSRRIVNVYGKADGLADALIAEHVEADTARAYQDRMAKGGLVLMVRAGYKPLGVAQITRDVAAEFGAADMGGLSEEVYVKDEPAPLLNILPDHPHIMTKPLGKSRTNYYMADWPIPLLSRRKPAEGSVLTSHPHLFDYPMPLLYEIEPFTHSIFPRHARMANFPIPLISRRKPKDNFAFPRHARMANFPIPLLSRRKPRDRFAFPRHQRMANWPFPLLINGEQHTNSLMPGAPRMANFPIPLLSRRKPRDNFAFPRHARMANFPIPLISSRKPKDKFAFPRHKRMADFPIPLVVEHAGTDSSSGARGFSFSKMFGWPTVSRR